MKTKLATGLVLGFFLAANSSGAERSSQVAPNNELATITIEVYDYAHVKPSRLLEAERTAAAILSKAGVEIAWQPRSTDRTSFSTSECAVAVDPTHLTLRILPDSMSKNLRPVHGDALGFASLCPEFSYNARVLYDRVERFAWEQQLNYERLLGAVIAHELGHLLLGENAHPAAGLMHGYWSRRELLAIDLALLVFSDTETKRIQSGVIARREAASVAVAQASSLDSHTHLN